MIVKSKKTGLEQFVTREGWEAMDRGDRSHFSVINRDDTVPEKPEPIIIPEVREFIAKQKEYQEKKTEKKPGRPKINKPTK